MTCLVYPIINHLHSSVTMNHASTIFESGADGVFILTHTARDVDLFAVCQDIKALYPHKSIGINCVSATAIDGYESAIELGLDMCWVGASDIITHSVTTDALYLQELIFSYPDVKLFGALSQRQYTKITFMRAVSILTQMGAVPTLCGTTPGSPPSMECVAEIKERVDAPIAVSCGLTHLNVDLYKQHVAFLLVSDGIYRSPQHIDVETLRAFVQGAKS